VPFPKKFTDEEIIRFYNEWQKSGLDLKTFCRTYTPTPLPYTTIYKRFKRLFKAGKRLKRHPQIIADLTVPIQKTIAKEIISKAEKDIKIIFELGKGIKEFFEKNIDELIEQAYINLGETVVEKLTSIYHKRLSPAKVLEILENLESTKKARLLEMLYNDVFVRYTLEKITRLKAIKYLLTHGDYPKNIDDILSI